MPFLTDIKVSRPAGSSGSWVLMEPLTYQGKHDRFEVPAGFYTDFASVPRLFQGLIPKNGKHDAAAIMHDYFYTSRPVVAVPLALDWAAYETISRKDADGLFKRMMRELGVNPIRYHIVYIAVRLFGWMTWNTPA